MKINFDSMTLIILGVNKNIECFDCAPNKIGIYERNNNFRGNSSPLPILLASLNFLF
jgi:hypothetical protein